MAYSKCRMNRQVIATTVDKTTEFPANVVDSVVGVVSVDGGGEIVVGGSVVGGAVVSESFLNQFIICSAAFEVFQARFFSMVSIACNDFSVGTLRVSNMILNCKRNKRSLQ